MDRLATATAHSEEPLTYRRGFWWGFPLLTLVVYLGFIVYATYRVLQPWIEGASTAAAIDTYYTTTNGHYLYLSPFGTPNLTFLVPAFIHNIPFVGAVLRSPAAVILPFPAGFRFTCYYYRKSYYRAFVGRPYACAVPAAQGYNYKGERGLLMLQNLHRYFLYAAIIITVFLAIDAFRSIFVFGAGGAFHLYFGLGSLIMVVNVAFLMLYTFGCHSFRHLVGGKLDMYSCDPLARWRYGLWSKVTMLNERHALWAWLSLLTVSGVDVYIRYVVVPMQAHGVDKLFGVIPL